MLSLRKIYGDTAVSLFTSYKRNRTKIGHDVVLEEIKGRSEVSIVDIGMGTGQQTFKLLERLKGTSVKKVNVVGIEPMKDALDQAEKKFKESEFPFEVVFIGRHGLLEDINDQVLEGLSCIAPNPIVWASFALHHVRSDRTRELARIKSILSPSLVVLLEPNVDHYTDNYGQRFFNCFNHFKVTFDIIDSLGLTPDQTESLKQFFAREIFDILGKDETKRTERHEPVSSWVSRLTEAGFYPVSVTGSYQNEFIHIVNNPTHVSLESKEGFPLTSVIVAK